MSKKGHIIEFIDYTLPNQQGQIEWYPTCLPNVENYVQGAVVRSKGKYWRALNEEWVQMEGISEGLEFQVVDECWMDEAGNPETRGEDQ